MMKIFVFLLFIKLIESRGGQQMVNGVESDIMPFMVSVRNSRMDSPFGAGEICEIKESLTLTLCRSSLWWDNHR